MFPDILPDKEVADRWWKEIEKNSAERANRTDEEWASEYGEDRALPGFDAPLTKDEEARMRFAHSYSAKPKFAQFGPRWGRGLSLIYYTRTQEARKEMDDILERLHLFKYKSSNWFNKTLKDLSDMMKKLGEFSGYNDWKQVIYWDQQGGYAPRLDPSLFADDIKNWVTGDKIHKTWNGMEMSEDTFLDDLEEGMMQILGELPGLERANKISETPLEWANALTNWAGSGTSSEPPNVKYYNRDNHVVKVRKSKWATALTTDPKHVATILTTPVALQQKPKAIQKPELSKVRAIVSADNNLYLRMAYISHWLETALVGNDKSMLWMTRQQQVDFWFAMGERTKAKVGVNIPLDQSHFDWQQNKRMIRRFIRVVRRLIETRAAVRIRGYLLTTLSLVEQSMLDIDFEVTIQGTDLAYKYGKGILSGWRWTALIDTVMNWGELHAAIKLLQRMNISLPLVSLNAQGDDDQVTTTSKGRAIALTLAYNLMNFEVNPGKFFISERRDEYLRQVGEGGTVSGYPCRATNAILWRNPTSKDPPAGINRAREMLHSWNVLLSRGSDAHKIAPLLRMDLANGNGWASEEVCAVLRTPVAFGGLGWNLDEPGEWMAFTPTQVKKEFRFFNGKFKGTTPAVRKLSQTGLELGKKDVMEWAKGLFDVRGVRTEIIGGETRVVPWVRPYHRNFASEGGAPLQMTISDEARTTFGTYPVEVAVLRKDWKWLQEVAVSEEQRLISESILHRGGRRIWVDWLLGKLPFSTPEVPYWANDVVGYDLNRLYQNAFSWLLTKHKFGYESVRRAAYTAERQVRLFLSGLPVRLGG
jgi:hypothetical protein